VLYFSFLLLPVGTVHAWLSPVITNLEGTVCVAVTASTTLQRQNTEISKQIFPEKEYRGLSPNFHIHTSVSELHIPTIGLPILLEEIQYVDRSWDYINRSQTHECGNWD
jgi:hypothetical protein